MTDEPLSTTITEVPTVSGGGQVNTPETAPDPVAEPKSTSIRDTLNAEMKAARAADKPKTPTDEAKADTKPTDAPKGDPKPDAPTRDEAKEAPAQQEKGDEPSEGKKPDPVARTKYDNPPEKVAHHARDKWANVPREIKAEVHRIVEAQETETRQYQEDRQFRESLREYDDLAKKAGTTVPDAMKRYVDVDRRLNSADQNERARTVLEIMQNSQVDPVQFARSILANEGQFRQQPQARPDPMVAQMSQQLQQLTQHIQQQEQQQRAAPLQQAVDQFTADKPDFDDLQGDIADLLKSGIIQKRFPGLAPDQLLAEAYRRAGGAYLTSQPGTQAAPQDPIAQVEEPPRPVNPDAGRKSISGAPTGGKTPIEAGKGKSLTEILREEARKKRA